jgi:hypothetical protein
MSQDYYAERDRAEYRAGIGHYESIPECSVCHEPITGNIFEVYFQDEGWVKFCFDCRKTADEFEEETCPICGEDAESCECFCPECGELTEECACESEPA